MFFFKNFDHKMVTPIRIPSSSTYHNSLYDNMGDTGLEPLTPCLSSKGSIDPLLYNHGFAMKLERYLDM
jgi:hypothetical protein